MRKTTQTARNAPQAAAPCPSRDPDVLLDVELDERSALQFVLIAHGAAPAHAVRVRFSHALRDLNGSLLGENPLYTQLEFLPPGRRVALFVDTLAGYRARRQAMRFDVRLEWRSDDGRPLRRTITHDLNAWAGVRTLLGP